MKSEEKKARCPCCGYLCCVLTMFLIALSIVFWYITIPIIAILIGSYIYISHKNQIKLYNSLDTKEKREEYTKEIGYLPIDKGKFTGEYKSWLIKKENERKSFLQPQQISQSEPTYQPTPEYKPEPTYQPKPTYQPATRQVKRTEKPISVQISPKDFKVKFKDYTANEKVIRLTFESIATIVLISFIILAVMSFIDRQYQRGIIFLIIMAICIIPNEIVEYKLRNKARIRKMKDLTEMKIQRNQYYQPLPAYQQEPAYRPPPKQEIEIEKIICPYCGGENNKTVKFCKNCGSRLD